MRRIRGITEDHFTLLGTMPPVKWHARIRRTNKRIRRPVCPTLAIVSRNSFPLIFRRVAPDIRLVPSTSRGGTWDVFFWVRDLSVLYDDFLTHGAAPSYPPTFQEAYHMMEFALTDLNGYVLGFGEESPPAAAR